MQPSILDPVRKSHHSLAGVDFDRSPLIVFYETTRACNLRCVHCRADVSGIGIRMS